VFKFSYEYSDHSTYLRNLADVLGVPIEKNTIWLPPATGEGYIKMVELANGLQVLINECILNTGIHFFREKSALHSFTLRFDLVRNMKNLTIEMGEDRRKANNEFYSGAFLTNSLSTFGYTADAGVEDRCVNIYFTEAWFNKYSGVKSTDFFLTKYLSLKTAAFTFEILNIEYRELMEEIFALKEEHPIYKTVLQNRVMLLLEKFLRNLYNKMSGAALETALEESDIKRLMQVESILVTNLGATPPAITELARVAMMSETKLKSVFKKMYGLNPYEYYQKNRMLKARQLLQIGRYSVKEIGIQLGFQNLSNFTIAYKKAFNMLPSNV
jgi:AraC-like DNA-binding protein